MGPPAEVVEMSGGHQAILSGHRQRSTVGDLHGEAVMMVGVDICWYTYDMVTIGSEVITSQTYLLAMNDDMVGYGW